MNNLDTNTLDPLLKEYWERAGSPPINPLGNMLTFTRGAYTDVLRGRTKNSHRINVLSLWHALGLDFSELNKYLSTNKHPTLCFGDADAIYSVLNKLDYREMAPIFTRGLHMPLVYCILEFQAKNTLSVSSRLGHPFRTSAQNRLYDVSRLGSIDPDTEAFHWKLRSLIREKREKDFFARMAKGYVSDHIVCIYDIIDYLQAAGRAENSEAQNFSESDLSSRDSNSPQNIDPKDSALSHCCKALAVLDSFDNFRLYITRISSYFQFYIQKDIDDDQIANSDKIRRKSFFIGRHVHKSDSMQQYDSLLRDIGYPVNQNCLYPQQVHGFVSHNDNVRKFFAGEFNRLKSNLIVDGSTPEGSAEIKQLISALLLEILKIPQEVIDRGILEYKHSDLFKTAHNKYDAANKSQDTKSSPKIDIQS